MSQSPAPPRWRWLGFWKLPRRAREQLLAVPCALSDRLSSPALWLAAGVVLGVGPLLIDLAFATALHRWIMPVALLPFLLAASARDRGVCGIGFLGVLFLAHCAAATALSAWLPERMALILTGGVEYWDKSLSWIRGFDNPEYEPSSWLPAQLQALGGFLLLAYLSLGSAPLWQGFYELGLMNYYVGRLAEHSTDPALAVVLGWHPWSLCRGVGYLFLTFEMCSLTLEQLTATTLSTRRRRLTRWTLGLTFLALDIGIKYFSMASIRERLAANLA